jgi:hypothetical protein
MARKQVQTAGQKRKKSSHRRSDGNEKRKPREHAGAECLRVDGYMHIGIQFAVKVSRESVEA